MKRLKRLFKPRHLPTRETPRPEVDDAKDAKRRHIDATVDQRLRDIEETLSQASETWAKREQK